MVSFPLIEKIVFHRGSIRVATVGLLILLVNGCGITHKSSTGTNTNWLKACSAESDCDADNQCLCSVCTQPCSEKAQCDDFGERASCLPIDKAACGYSASSSACFRDCDSDSDCDSLDQGRCLAGRCFSQKSIELIEGVAKPDSGDSADAGVSVDAGPSVDAGLSVDSGKLVDSSTAGDAGASLEICGNTVCKEGEYCCNESCGICAPLGEGCIALWCGPTLEPCDETECGSPIPEPTDLCPDGSATPMVCERDQDGECGWTVGQCPSTPSDSCDGCAEDEYCEVENCGRNGETGVCVPGLGYACDDVYDPVCGCDGTTYSNECSAHSLGQSVDYMGECEVECSDGFADCNNDPVDGCETNLMSSSNNCGECGTICEYVCVYGSCEAQCAPGFGDCDEDASNGCETSLYSGANCGACGEDCGGTACIDGACSDEALNCGGFAGFVCSTGEYCDYAAGNGCFVADGMGLCRTQPELCTMQYDPVCGCDNVTYGNSCSAAAAEMSVQYLGECKTGVCTYGMDQTCNDNPIISSIHGVCNPDGTCLCAGGWAINPQSGRCL